MLEGLSTPQHQHRRLVVLHAVPGLLLVHNHHPDTQAGPQNLRQGSDDVSPFVHDPPDGVLVDMQLRPRWDAGSRSPRVRRRPPPGRQDIQARRHRQTDRCDVRGVRHPVAGDPLLRLPSVDHVQRLLRGHHLHVHALSLPLHGAPGGPPHPQPGMDVDHPQHCGQEAPCGDIAGCPVVGRRGIGG